MDLKEGIMVTVKRDLMQIVNKFRVFFLHKNDD